jgi:hypothetical protein
MGVGDLFYRLLGSVSALNALLGAVRIYGMIPLNWMSLPPLAWHTFDAARQLSEAWPPLAPGRDEILLIVRITLSMAAIVLIVICMIRENIIFRVRDWPLGNGSRLRAAGEKPAWAGGMRMTGKVRRGKDTLAVRGFPVSLHVAETGEVFLEARVTDAPGFPTDFSNWEDRSGTWSVAVSRESLQDGLEEGALFLSIRARPALRLTRPGTREPVILSFPNPTELQAFVGALDEIVADSAQKEAIFNKDLMKVASQSTTAKKPVGDVNWDNLIDFSA